MPTPPLVRDGAIEAIRARKSVYSFPEGALELRDAVAQKFARDSGLTVDARSEIVITVGATGAFAATLTALFDPGDGIVLFEPYYGYHLNTATIAGLVPSFVTLAPPRFAVEEADVERAILPNTRAIVVCTPANPSGKMWSEGELAMLARVAERHDLVVITDEIYEYIRYDGRPHIAPATIGNLRDRTVTIGGLSKTFSITGWRLGWAIAREPLARAITLVNDLYYVCAPTPLQHGAAAGFAAPRAFFDELASSYQAKRDRICKALDKAGLPPIVPEGAYYVLADASRLGHATAREASMHILERARVASVPGSAFYRGAAGESLVRFCFAKEDDVLEEACRRLEAIAK